MVSIRGIDPAQRVPATTRMDREDVMLRGATTEATSRPTRYRDVLESLVLRDGNRGCQEPRGGGNEVGLRDVKCQSGR